MATVTFVGTGEAFDPDLPNTSILYRGQKNLLLDCGYAVPHAFWRITRDADLLDAVYLSHRHADHCFGLPALLVWMRTAQRARPLALLGGTDAPRWLGDLLELGYAGALSKPDCFPIERWVIAPGTPFELGPVTFSVAVTRHSQKNHALRLEEGGRALCYSGDGAPSSSSRELYRQADVLVHECYEPLPTDSGHANLEELLTLAEEASVKQLCLLHLCRDPETKQRILDRASAHRGRVRIFVPRPGDSIQI